MSRRGQGRRLLEASRERPTRPPAIPGVPRLTRASPQALPPRSRGLLPRIAVFPVTCSPRMSLCPDSPLLRSPASD